MFRSDQVQISRTRWKKGKRVLDGIQTDTLMALSDWLALSDQIFDWPKTLSCWNQFESPH